MFTEIDFKKAIITYINFDIEFSRPFKEQTFSLKEDLFQAEYKNSDKYIIDIGWYPEMDPNGNFKIRIIKNYDWESPLFSKSCKAKNELTSYVKEAINLISKLK